MFNLQPFVGDGPNDSVEGEGSGREPAATACNLPWRMTRGSRVRKIVKEREPAVIVMLDIAYCVVVRTDIARE